MAKNGITYGKHTVKRYRKAKAMRRYRKRNIVRIPRPMSANTYEVTLCFGTSLKQAPVGATQFGSFYQGDAYDVDPSLGNTAMPGFSEYAAFYARFRPLRVGYKFEFMNNELFPVICTANISTAANVYSGVKPIATVGNSLYRQKTITNALGGPSMCTLKDSKKVTQVYGTKSPLYDDLFTGLTTAASIAKPCFINYACQSTGGEVFTASTGVDITVRIFLFVQFYQPNWLKV